MPLPDMHLYRHPEIQTPRPYGFDVDADGWLWEACGPGRLYAHHLPTAAARLIELPERRGTSCNQCFAYGGMVVGLLQDCADLLIYDPATGAAAFRPLPVAQPIVWYGLQLADGRLVLFERGQGSLILLDGLDGGIRVVRCPFAGSPATGHIAAGQQLSDGLVYIMVRDPARIIRFDPASDRFVDEIPFSEAGAGPSGFFEADGVLYIADSAAGRLLPFDLRAARWHAPIPASGYGALFGFIGSATPFRDRGYFSLSTYRFISSVNPATGKLNLPEGWDIGVDGRRPPRFLDRQLVFDPATGDFDFLTVPAQPDGMPLVCYAWADETRLVFTGYVIPFDDDGNPSERPGDWLVWQSG